MTTTVTAAAQWTGGNFAIGDGDIPHWIVQAMGSAMLSFEGVAPGMTVTVTTSSGPATANPTDWVFLAPAVGTEGQDGFVPATLGVATNDDFTRNFEISPS